VKKSSAPASATSATVGQLVDDAMAGIERDNPALDKQRRGQVLFIDARKLGRMADRTHKELTDDDIAHIATTYHAWRGEQDAGEYADIAGFCKSAKLEAAIVANLKELGYGG